MPRKKVENVATLERRLTKARQEHYELKLYVAGSTVRAARAIENIKELCEKHLHGRYDLKVIDLYQNPVLARGEQIIAAPTLVKSLPLPLRKVIGDMTDEDSVLVGLDLRRRT